MTTLKLSVTTFGLSQQQARYLNSKKIPNRADRVVGKFVGDLASEYTSRPYAARLPNQRYVRRGRFGRGWESGRVSQSKYYIDNTAAAKGRFYARYVVGDSIGSGQASIHRGRWWVFRKDLDSKIPDLVESLEDMVLETVE